MIKTRFSPDDCVEYMKQKYGREFTFTGPFDEFQPTLRSYKMLAASPDYPGEDIFVVEEDTGEELRFRDNFPAVMYEQDVLRLVTELTKAVYGECKVFYSRSANRVIPEVPGSFSEYISMKNSVIHFTILLPPDAPEDVKDEKAKALAASLCENGMVCSFSVYYTGGSDAYGEVAAEKDFPRTMGWYSAYGYFCTDGSAVTEESWR